MTVKCGLLKKGLTEECVEQIGQYVRRSGMTDLVNVSDFHRQVPFRRVLCKFLLVTIYKFSLNFRFRSFYRMKNFQQINLRKKA